MLKNIDHIGLAMVNIEENLDFWQNLLEIAEVKVEVVEDQKVKVAFLQVGESKIELLQPTEESSPVAKFLANKGEGIHHIALKVDNLEEKLAELKNKDVPLIDQSPRIGAGGAKIAFLHPKAANGVLLELCEKEVIK